MSAIEEVAPDGESLKKALAQVLSELSKIYSGLEEFVLFGNSAREMLFVLKYTNQEEVDSNKNAHYYKAMVNDVVRGVAKTPDTLRKNIKGDVVVLEISEAEYWQLFTRQDLSCFID